MRKFDALKTYQPNKELWDERNVKQKNAAAAV